MNFAREHVDNNDIQFKLKKFNINISNLKVTYNKVTNEVSINVLTEDPPSASTLNSENSEENTTSFNVSTEKTASVSTSSAEEAVDVSSGDEDEKNNSPEPNRKKQKIETSTTNNTTTTTTDNQSLSAEQLNGDVSTVNCKLDLQNNPSHLLLKYIDSFDTDYDAKVSLKATKTGITYLTQIFNKAILKKYFSTHYHIIDNNNTCNVFYIFWGSCSKKYHLGFLICFNCFYTTSRDHVVLKAIEHITPLKAFTCHIHCDAHYHCSWCFKDTCNTSCEQFRSHEVFSISELWTKK